MTRWQIARIYSPVIVLIAWALYITMFGRTDESVVIWLGVLAITVVLHTKELIRIYGRRHKR